MWLLSVLGSTACPSKGHDLLSPHMKGTQLIGGTWTGKHCGTKWKGCRTTNQWSPSSADGSQYSIRQQVRRFGITPQGRKEGSQSRHQGPRGKCHVKNGKNQSRQLMTHKSWNQPGNWKPNPSKSKSRFRVLTLRSWSQYWRQITNHNFFRNGLHKPNLYRNQHRLLMRINHDNLHSEWSKRVDNFNKRKKTPKEWRGNGSRNNNRRHT